MINKSNTVRELISNNEYKKALSIARGFRLGISKEDSDKIKLAYECLIHPEFYQQIGTDTIKAVDEGKQILIYLYGEK